jgi:hypothetical protein
MRRESLEGLGLAFVPEMVEPITPRVGGRFLQKLMRLAWPHQAPSDIYPGTSARVVVRPIMVSDAVDP